MPLIPFHLPVALSLAGTVAACASLSQADGAGAQGCQRRPGADHLLDAELTAAMRREGLPSLVAVVMDADGVCWSASLGDADAAAQAPATLATPYLLSSLGKLIVAVAVMQQVEAGRVSLTADVSRYLPFVLRHPAAADRVLTIEDLLMHRAGLANPASNHDGGFNALTPIDVVPDVMGWLVQTRRTDPGVFWLASPPGRSVSSNLGVAILAEVARQAAGEPSYAAYVRRRILEPLGMLADYTLPLPDGASTPAEVHLPDGTVIPQPMSINYSAGLIRASAADLTRFVQAILGGGALGSARILQSQSVAEMLRLRDPDADLAYHSGVGLLWRWYGSDRWVGHTGGGGVGSTSLDLDPVRGIGVILLTNIGGRPVVHPGGAIYETVHRLADRLAAGVGGD